MKKHGQLWHPLIHYLAEAAEQDTEIEYEELDLDYEEAGDGDDPANSSDTISRIVNAGKIA